MEAMGLDVDFKRGDDYYYQLAERKRKAKLEKAEAIKELDRLLERKA